MKGNIRQIIEILSYSPQIDFTRLNHPDWQTVLRVTYRDLNALVEVCRTLYSVYLVGHRIDTLLETSDHALVSITIYLIVKTVYSLNKISAHGLKLSHYLITPVRSWKVFCRRLQLWTFAIHVSRYSTTFRSSRRS